LPLLKFQPSYLLSRLRKLTPVFWMSRYIHPCPKNASQVRPNIKWILVIFVECESIVYENFFFLQDERLNSINTGRFCNIGWKKSAENLRNMTQNGFFFTVKMSISTLLCQFQTFWRLKMWLCSCSLFTILAWSVIIFLVSDHESGATRAPCPWCFWHSWTLTGRPICDPESQFQQCFLHW